jgi:hypothetical protein
MINRAGMALATPFGMTLFTVSHSASLVLTVCWIPLGVEYLGEIYVVSINCPFDVVEGLAPSYCGCELAV